MTVGAATLALGGRILGANDRVRLAIGNVAGTKIAGMCGVDENVLNQRLADVEKMGLARPKSYGDIRRLLEDQDIDSISIATPNRWHSLMAIWACQAGKDVYVEKPCSHNWFAGRQLVRAVKKYNLICQNGSQSRSNPGMIEAIKRVNDGIIGNTDLARALCYKWRPSIGHAQPEAVTAGINYDRWTRPAPMKPFTGNRFHYNWHWIWDTGNGEIGNQAIHEIDLARWGLGVRSPVQGFATGGHFMFDDDQETPNTLNATFAFGEPQGKRKMMELEVRHWITNHGAEIGTNAYGASGIPPSGLTKKPEDKQVLGPKTLKPTPSAISSTDQTVTWQSMDAMPTRPGSRIRSSLDRPAKHPATTGQTSSIAFAAGAPKIFIVRLRKVISLPLWCTWQTRLPSRSRLKIRSGKGAGHRR